MRIWNYPRHEAAGQKEWVDATLRKGEIFLFSFTLVNVRALLGEVFGEPLFSDTFLHGTSASTSGSPAAVLLLHQRMLSRDGHFQGVGLTIAHLAPGNMCATGGGTRVPGSYHAGGLDEELHRAYLIRAGSAVFYSGRVHKCQRYEWQCCRDDYELFARIIPCGRNRMRRSTIAM